MTCASNNLTDDIHWEQEDKNLQDIFREQLCGCETLVWRRAGKNLLERTDMRRLG